MVKVGADSKVEMKEKKDRVEDAIYATKAALKEGIVQVGCGAAVVVYPAKGEVSTDLPDHHSAEDNSEELDIASIDGLSQLAPGLSQGVSKASAGHGPQSA